MRPVVILLCCFALLLLALGGTAHLLSWSDNVVKIVLCLGGGALLTSAVGALAIRAMSWFRGVDDQNVRRLQRLGSLVLREGVFTLSDDISLTHATIVDAPNDQYCVWFTQLEYLDGTILESVRIGNRPVIDIVNEERASVLVDSGCILILAGSSHVSQLGIESLAASIERAHFHARKANISMVVDERGVTIGLLVYPPYGDGEYPLYVRRGSDATFEMILELEKH